jgi:hypothetical protein
MFNLHRWIPNWTPIYGGVIEEYIYISQDKTYKIHFSEIRNWKDYNEPGFYYIISSQDDETDLFEKFVKYDDFQKDRKSVMDKVRENLTKYTNWIAIDPIPLEIIQNAYQQKQAIINELIENVTRAFETKDGNKLYESLKVYNRQVHDVCSNFLLKIGITCDMDSTKFLYENAIQFKSDDKYYEKIKMFIGQISIYGNLELIKYVKSIDMIPSDLLYSVLIKYGKKMMATFVMA